MFNFPSGITEPTAVQTAVIPLLLKGDNIVLAASTGSGIHLSELSTSICFMTSFDYPVTGKTLTYALPVIQHLKEQEEKGYIRMPSRPRCLVLVPTRDLAKQVLSCVKMISHHVKISSGAVLGGEANGPQRDMLKGYSDVLVASPGRLLIHKDKGHVYLGHVTHIVIDEVDTMLTQGFGADIRAILQSVVLHPNKTEAISRFVSAYAQVNTTDRVSERVLISNSPVSAVQVIYLLELSSFYESLEYCIAF